MMVKMCNMYVYQINQIVYQTPQRKISMNTIVSYLVHLTMLCGQEKRYQLNIILITKWKCMSLRRKEFMDFKIIKKYIFSLMEKLRAAPAHMHMILKIKFGASINQLDCLSRLFQSYLWILSISLRFYIEGKNKKLQLNCKFRMY